MSHKTVVLGNGQMCVGLNMNGLVDDFYYPYVGQENLSSERIIQHKIGVFVDGEFSWLNDGSWKTKIDYEKDALIGITKYSNDDLGVELDIRSVVDTEHTAFLRLIHVTNSSASAREIRVFLHQAFQISNNGRGDTCFYEPDSSRLIDYKGHTVLSTYARNSDGPMSSYSIGNYGIEGKEGTHVDAEDGELSENNVEHGGVDSVVGLYQEIAANSTATLEYWIVAGQDHQEVEYTHDQLLKTSVVNRIALAKNKFGKWLEVANKNMTHIPEADRIKIRHSLLMIIAHTDVRGSILASSDSSIYNYGRDYYAYCWPRDGAYAIWPLIRLGYSDIPKRFFEFCRRVMHQNGYLQHKFQPDGSYGSTWHPLIQHHHKELAIQEDETAGVLYMLAEYVERSGDTEYFVEVYEDFVKPACDFMTNYIDQLTGLPHASYDLWEEKFLTTTYTTFLVSNTLRRMAKLANEIADDKSVGRWVVAAETIDGNAHQLYDRDRGYFIKGLYLGYDSLIEKDTTLDISSMYGVLRFGGGLEGTQALRSTVDKIESQLVAKTPNGGVPRYNDDYYMRISQDTPGNPWFIAAYWLAQYYIMNNNLERALELIDWCERHRLESGVMSEQISPTNSTPTGVAPLVWSHAEHVNTMLDYYSALLAKKS
ncbi:MAG: glycoside hydrolase family 15 protein [Patescibacteria group bacterium]